MKVNFNLILLRSWCVITFGFLIGLMQACSPSANNESLQEKIGYEGLKAGTYTEALALCKAGRYREGILIANFLIKSNPKLEEVFYLKGQALNRLSAFPEALSALDKALALKPDYCLAIATKGDVYQKQKDFDKARVIYENALACNANDWRVMVNIGALLMKQKRFADAIPYFDKALSIRPDNVDCIYDRAKSYYRVSQYKKAVADCKRALILAPSDYEVYLVEGAALTKLGSELDATACYQKVLQLNPDNKWAIKYFASKHN